MGWPSHSRRGWLSLVPVELARRKRYGACDELFYFTANLVVHAFCCFSPLNCNRCASLRLEGETIPVVGCAPFCLIIF